MRTVCLVVFLASCTRHHPSILRFEFRPAADAYLDLRLLAVQVEVPGGTYSLTSAEFSDGRAEGAPTAKLELTRPGPARVRVSLRASPAETLATAAFDVRLAPDSAWDVVIRPGWVPLTGPGERAMMPPRRHVVVPIKASGRAADSMLVQWGEWSIKSPSLTRGVRPGRAQGDIAARSTDRQGTTLKNTANHQKPPEAPIEMRVRWIQEVADMGPDALELFERQIFEQWDRASLVAVRLVRLGRCVS